MIKTKVQILRDLKLVVLDLDGTILDNENNISDETINLIAKLKDRGLKFTIASARYISSFLDYIKLLNIDSPVICLDGSVITNPITEEYISELFIPSRYVLRSVKTSEKYSLNFILCCKDGIYYNKDSYVSESLLHKYGTEYKLINSIDDYVNKTYEVVIAGNEFEILKKVKRKMIFPYTYGVQASIFKSRRDNGNYILEIKKIGINKGTALKKLCNYLDIKIKDAAVIGDWYNDISLFNTNAFKVAMANAVPEIKKLADIITTKSNNEEGINEFLNLLLELKSK